MLQIQLVTDCEGPLALNDLAFELCREFLPPLGDRFFTPASRYDDYLAEIAKPPGSPGRRPLKLILPFLKARGPELPRLPGVLRREPAADARRGEETYRFLHRFGFPIFETSTSYRQFAEAVGVGLGFDPEHIWGAALDLDRYPLGPAETAELRRLEEEILGAPAWVLPPTPPRPWSWAPMRCW